MLSDAPGARGGAGELAQALEHAEDHAGADADTLITRKPRRAGTERRVRPRLVLAALGLATAVGGAVLAISSQMTVQPHEHQPGDAVVALGDAASQASDAPTSQPEQSQEIRLDMPKGPFPGQVLPPCKGIEVEIELTPGRKDTRSCWIKADTTPEKCRENGYEYRGGCYRPSYPPPRVPQSIGP
jgi:serine/threonine-protein kinase